MNNATKISNGVKAIINNLQNRQLIENENIGLDQVLSHINRARKDIQVSKANLEIDTEAAYNYAYLAMLRSGRALMFSYGYRPINGQQHKTVVEFCGGVLGEEYKNLTEAFDRMRKFRNKFTYAEPGILVSRQQTEQSLERAKIFVEKVAEIIQAKNPQKELFVVK